MQNALQLRIWLGRRGRRGGIWHGPRQVQGTPPGMLHVVPLLLIGLAVYGRRSEQRLHGCGIGQGRVDDDFFGMVRVCGRWVGDRGFGIHVLAHSVGGVEGGDGVVGELGIGRGDGEAEGEFDDGVGAVEEVGGVGSTLRVVCLVVFAPESFGDGFDDGERLVEVKIGVHLAGDFGLRVLGFDHNGEDR